MIFLKLFLAFFKIGLFTFGGGLAMIPLIQSEVTANAWLTADELVDFIAISESTPGPLAINLSTYVGMRAGGIPGALCATLGVVLPSFVIILIVAGFYSRFRKAKAVQWGLSGLKPAVIGLIASAAVSVAETVFFPSGFSATVLSSPAFYVSGGIFGIMVILSFRKISPIVIILLSAAAGICSGYLLGL